MDGGRARGCFAGHPRPRGAHGPESGGGGRPARRPRKNRGGAGPGLAGCPGWPLPAGGSRYLSRSGAETGTPPTPSNPPAGHRGRDRPVAVGPPGIGGWNPAQRLVAVLGLPDGGGGPRAGTPSLREMARREGGGMPSQSFGDCASRLPLGEAGRRTTLDGDKPSGGRRASPSGSLPVSGHMGGKPARRNDRRTG